MSIVLRIAVFATALVGWTTVQAQESTMAGALGLTDWPADGPILVLEPNSPAGAGNGGSRLGCGDEGFDTYPYAVADPLTSNYVWLNANTMYGDDLTLEPGIWTVGCYDVFIFADNDPNYGCHVSRTVTLRAHESCNGPVIPGSQESWTVPPHGGPILLTGVTNIDFEASGTIWFSLTTTAHQCDGWYVSHQNLAGATTTNVQEGADCAQFIEGAYNRFHVVLYGSVCEPAVINADPAGATVCAGQSRSLCVVAGGSEPLEYQWQLDGEDIAGATSSCHLASAGGTYQCVVSNDCGLQTSEAAVLTVSTGPAVIEPPVGGVACDAQPWEVCVSADGIGDLTYQWKRNGFNLIGATDACHPATQAGDYWAIITDDCGSTTSPSAEVLTTAPAAGDFNADGYADLDDFALLADCLSGPVNAPPPGCGCTDTNTDGRVDLADFATVQRAVE